MQKTTTAILVLATVAFATAGLADTPQRSTPRVTYAADPIFIEPKPPTPQAEIDAGEALNKALASIFGSREAWLQAAQEEVDRAKTEPQAVPSGRLLAHGRLESDAVQDHITESGEEVIVTNSWEGGGALIDGESSFSFPGIGGGFVASDPTTGYLLVTYERGSGGEVGLVHEFFLPTTGEIRIDRIDPAEQVTEWSWREATATVVSTATKERFTVNLKSGSIAKVSPAR
jgi:hypothetical protein